MERPGYSFTITKTSVLLSVRNGNLLNLLLTQFNSSNRCGYISNIVRTRRDSFRINLDSYMNYYSEGDFMVEDSGKRCLQICLTNV